MLQIENLEGFVRVHPVIKNVTFEKKGYIDISLEDGRHILAPLRVFPSIKKLNALQRKKYAIADGQVIIWEAANEVFHLQQFLGREQDYAYSVA